VLFTPRRRAFVAVLVALPLGWFYVELSWRIVYNLLEILRNHSGYVGCGSGLSGLVSKFNGCGNSSYHWTYAVFELVLFTGVATAIGYGLARWVVLPIRQLADDVGQFGPTSLGLRIRASGPRDETRHLSEEIDAMLDRLAEGYEAQRRFASNASHELRTPLATQRALIEVSLSSALTDEQLQLLSRQLLATNERNEKLVDGLLTLAETERGLMTTNAVRLDAVVGAVVDLLRATAKERDIELAATLAPVAVLGEEPLLDRLASNIIFNALKYNHAGGTVSVDVGAGGMLTVANTGPLVPAEQVPALFEPFRRLSGERLDHGGGVGLGLTIARSIVAAHRGSIDAQPNPGGGLVVRVQLPVAPG
jgi:signal transduction histidine kinase